MKTLSLTGKFTFQALMLAVLILTNNSTLAQDSENHPGQAVYQAHCASCHDNSEETLAPAYSTLQQMSAGTIVAALTTGKMVAQGAPLSLEERRDLVGYLTTASQGDEWIANFSCEAPRSISASAQINVNGFGFDSRNTRSLSAAQAGLTTQDFAKLELAWSIGFPGVTGMRSQPALVDNMLYLPVAENAKVYAFDISNTDSPCLQWVYQSESILRSGAAYGEQADGRQIIAVNDYNATVHVLDAKSGELLWKQQLGQHQLALGTAIPAIHEGVIYVPVSQNEVMQGATESYICCKTHGIVVALDATTGERLWKAHTMEDAKPVRDRGDGQMLWGPSGAPIWSSPLIDAKRGLLYVGTGEATSAPAHKNTDAILAIDLKSGEIVWSFQATANDIFLVGCYGRSLNCEEDTVFKDFDFGGALSLGKLPDGRDIILGGQKSGTLWALDPDSEGAVVWTSQMGQGGPNGGIHWGITANKQTVFAPINRTFSGRTPPPDLVDQPGMYAINIANGERRWVQETKPVCNEQRKEKILACERRLGLSGAPALIDGAVVTGSIDGMLYAFDAQTGEILFQFDAVNEFETLNGITAKGGSFDSAGIVAGNGLLLVNSGYALFNELPGNVLLGFKVKNN
ncbi:MAG: PQQ-binding-like beta-propeller repeat protein [Pseudohongiellaceae bacterium]|nr:PQQ-binding-like beta-propeller repeat protein [Pseudohongiellaceae bacterium]